MLVADTNVWIAYLADDAGDDVGWLDAAMVAEATYMAPMVLAELLSSPAISGVETAALKRIPLLPVTDEYWERVGLLRATLQARRCRPRLVDTMIAQICIDHQASLLTRDAGFHRFIDAGLRLHK
jgi:predicted nucleic acid-binding protein